ncbi:N-acetylglucosamine-6-phosphate deacetylase [Acidianus brierleyi]|uniref:N-acetylglucosamine-6-phosphate deacetylase n=1 Tax=Acidianus brierleyi TaxID=41673 RepID=A0A2U9ID63_9CREN|nr:N-acetylglucosamine-6-phosphate deacetylase [Acidianus brierleyi]AWR93939.1 N-acetylglucosamine-6-phosphate deacetylase [Acidianus brierleyi]
MKLTNVRIIAPYREFIGTIEIEEGKIKRIKEGKEEGENLEGMIAIPGFVDIHTHGIGGYDFTSWDNKEDFIKNMLEMKKIYLKHGVTTFLPTTVTIPKENLMEACKAIGEIEDESIPGIHLEGPYISEKHAGAQDTRYIRNPDVKEIKECLELSKGKIKTITVAPEKDLDFISVLSKLGIHPSVGHTDADYDTAVKAFFSGADRTTHMFNAMRPFHHRDPGVILASINFSRYIEIISDFIHVDREVIKFLLNSVGINRIVAVTDSIIATDLKDGNYTLGKTTITVKDGKALTREGRLAGSTLTMDKAFRNLSSLRSLSEAVVMTSQNPAMAVDLKDRGSLEPGKKADIVILDEDLKVEKVYLNGENYF